MLTPLTEQLESLRPALLRFARLQLRNDAMAEDLAQDVLMAMLENPHSYTGQSSLRAHVIDVMKDKIVDVLRNARRTRAFAGGDDTSGRNLAEALFAADGQPLQRPRHWGNPDASLGQEDFFRVLELCLENLPSESARIFMLREWLGLEIGEICKELDISAASAGDLLYQARLLLRECLDLHWFGNRTTPGKK